MYDRTPEENLLVVDALVEFGHRHLEDEPERARRAWVLAVELALCHGLDPEDVLEGDDSNGRSEAARSG